jgi:hypothetical protein
MARKTAKDYKKEYTDASIRLAAVEIRIRRRCLEICKAHPDVPVDWHMLDVREPHVLAPTETSRTAGEFYDCIENKGMSSEPDRFIDIMRYIEAYNEDKAGIKQGKLFN